MVLIWSVISPRDLFTWFLEALPALIGLVIIIFIYNRFKLTNLVYFLILIHAIILMIGAHYTYNSAADAFLGTQGDVWDTQWDTFMALWGAISALSIHHLEDQQKADLYKKIFLMLRPGGLFINSDQVLGRTPYLDSLYKSLWKTSIEKSGFPKDEILAAYERTKLDKEATLQQQLHWLEEAGFSEVDCIYKYLNFAVMLGIKW